MGEITASKIDIVEVLDKMVERGIFFKVRRLSKTVGERNIHAHLFKRLGVDQNHLVSKLTGGTHKA